MNHRLGSTLTRCREFTPVDLSSGLVAGGLGRPIDETEGRDSIRAILLAFLVDVFTAIDLDASTLKPNAAPEAFIRDRDRRGPAFFDGGQLATVRVHGHFRPTRCGAGRAASRHAHAQEESLSRTGPASWEGDGPPWPRGMNARRLRLIRLPDCFEVQPPVSFLEIIRNVPALRYWHLIFLKDLGPDVEGRDGGRTGRPGREAAPPPVRRRERGRPHDAGGPLAEPFLTGGPNGAVSLEVPRASRQVVTLTWCENASR